MTRYDWPGERDPRRRDRAIRRNRDLMRSLLPVPDELIDLARSVRLAQLAATSGGPPDRDLWLPIGPSTVVKGQAGGKPRVSGRVRDLAVSSDGMRVYAATANGGVWYSGDAGTTWSPVGGWAMTPDRAAVASGANTLVCGCLHVTFGSAADGSGDDVYVGTGELRPSRRATPGGSMAGIGVLHLAIPLATALSDPLASPWKREAKNLVGSGIYRLARDPAAPDRIVAATSRGLFHRQGPFVEDANWSRVTASPFDFQADDKLWCTDVAWAPAQGSSLPSRLWVALTDAENDSSNKTSLYVSEAGVAGPFAKVNLENVVEGGRLGIAVAVSDPSVLYVLGKGPRLWRVDGTTARSVGNVPRKLFGEGSGDQSRYDLAVSVHPTDPRTVVLGGSTVKADGEWSASLFRCSVSGTAGSGPYTLDFQESNQSDPSKDDSYIGNGVHADLHAARYATPSGSVELWIGCDGGVFRSKMGGDPYTFLARNNGLAVLEAGYVAGHPTHDGVVLAGTQDNGQLERIGDTIWKLWSGGDGGGVVFHPKTPKYFMGQYTGATWVRRRGRLAPPVWRRSTSGTTVASEREEDGNASFYSGVDAMPGASGNLARLAIGTNRVWISEDWDPGGSSDNTWVTLPSGRDPRGAGGDDTRTDTLKDDNARHGEVIAVRWLSANRLLALCRRAVLLFKRAAGTGTWTRIEVSHHHPKCGFDNGDIDQPTSEYLPPLGQFSDIAAHDAGRGANGSCYVATTGHARLDDDTLVPSERMDTLWWYDGTGTWFPTGLRNGATGIQVPAYAVVCDPEDASIVYVGTAVGVWKGTLAFSGTTPSWTWTIFSNGLPEAAIQDLSFHRHGNVKLLRAAVQARGVWEVDLSAAPSPSGRTYLRVHPFDTRRNAPTDLARPTHGYPSAFSWFSSPDIRIRIAPGSPAPASPPTSLPWTDSSPILLRELWAFKTALHAVDPLCRPTQIYAWSNNFKARIKAQRVKHGLTRADEALVDAGLWNKVVKTGNIYAAPWDGIEPTEADLHELVYEHTTHKAGVGRVVEVGRQALKVDVLVHHRHVRPIPAAGVGVILLRRQVPSTEGSGSGVALADQWRANVVQLVNGHTPPLPDHWTVADPAGVRRPSGPVDARTPRAVTFDLDMSSAPANSNWMLLAVVSSTTDALEIADLTGTTLEDLVRGCSHVAAKLITVG
ncbi:MAG: hypothetical protein ACYTG6_04040 [Planctomycetota bacterium]|jgi:hypothetical protein